MKPYKTEKMNNKVREAVHYAHNWLVKHPSISRKYLSKDEFIMDIANLCNVTYNMAERITWIVRADAYCDEQAIKIWGFNKHTA